MSYSQSAVMGVPSSGNTADRVIGGITSLTSPVQLDGVEGLRVEDTSQFPDNGVVRVDEEYITYSGKTADTLTGIARAQFFPLDPKHGVAKHVTGAKVHGVFVGTSERNFQPDVMYDCKSATNGRVFLDFSNDNKDWDTFPKKGVSVPAGINVSRKAAKGPRWFRVRFENTETQQCRLRFYTYYGQHAQRVLPLDEPIDSDADSIVVQSVQTGEKPDGTYGRQSLPGVSAKNSIVNGHNNLTATVFTAEVAASDLVVPVPEGHGFRFTKGDSIMAGEELMRVTAVTSRQLHVERGTQETKKQSHAAGTKVGEAFVGDWAPVDTYSGITIIAKGKSATTAPGTLLTQFSATGDYITQSVAINVEDISMFPPRTLGCIARYFRVIYANVGNTELGVPDASPLQYMELQTHFTNTQVSVVSQLNQSLVGNEDVTTTRSVIVGQDPTGQFVNQKQDGYVFSVENVEKLPFDSGILDIAGYSQIQLEVYSDAPGVVAGIWFKDRAMSQVIRRFSLPFAAQPDGTYQLVNTSAPAYTRFLKVTYTSSASPTQIMLRFKVLTKAITGQVMGVTDFIAPNMASNLQRSITVGAQPDGDFVNLPADGSALSFNRPCAAAILKDGLRAGLNSTSLKLVSPISKADWSSSASEGSLSLVVVNREIMSHDYSAMTDPMGDTLTVVGRGLFGTNMTNHRENTVVRSVILSKWVDSDGWNTIEVFISSDQPSNPRGVIIQFTDDTQSESPVARHTKRYSFTQLDAIRGSRLFRFRPILDGFRVLYVPSAVPETTLYVDVTLKIAKESKAACDSLPISIQDHFQDRYARKKVILGYRSLFPDTNVVCDICMFAIDMVSTAYRLYTPASTAYSVELVSTSNEDAAGKSGIKKVGMVYLNQDWEEQYVELEMTGKKAVVAVDEGVMRVNDLFAVSVGSSGAAVGNIFCQTGDGSTIEGNGSSSPRGHSSKQTLRYIVKGSTKDTTGLFTVPANHTAYADTMAVSNAEGTQETRLCANVNPHTRERLNANCFLVQTLIYIASAGNNTKALQSLKFPEKTDIKFTSTTSNKRRDTSVSLSLTIIEDE